MVEAERIKILTDSGYIFHEDRKYIEFPSGLTMNDIPWETGKLLTSFFMEGWGMDLFKS